MRTPSTIFGPPTKRPSSRLGRLPGERTGYDLTLSRPRIHNHDSSRPSDFVSGALPCGHQIVNLSLMRRVEGKTLIPVGRVRKNLTARCAKCTISERTKEALNRTPSGVKLVCHAGRRITSGSSGRPDTGRTIGRPGCFLGPRASCPSPAAVEAARRIPRWRLG